MVFPSFTPKLYLFPSRSFSHNPSCSAWVVTLTHGKQRRQQEAGSSRHDYFPFLPSTALLSQPSLAFFPSSPNTVCTPLVVTPLQIDNSERDRRQKGFGRVLPPFYSSFLSLSSLSFLLPCQKLVLLSCHSFPNRCPMHRTAGGSHTKLLA